MHRSASIRANPSDGFLPTSAPGSPVVVIGAGPVGLAAAAHLIEAGLRPVVFEAGADVGHAVRQWGHVPLFSPWHELVDPLLRGRLERHGWKAPDPDARPTGADLVRDLLEPAARLPEIARSLRLGHRVTAVTRAGLDRMKTAGRDETPFLVVAEGPEREVRVEARAVIDASGTWSQPRPLGASGIPAEGEARLRSRIRYRAPDVLGSERARYAGRRTLVVGSGHSSLHVLADLVALAREVPGTRVVWALRRRELGDVFGRESLDPLSGRAELGRRARRAASSDAVEVVTDFRLDRLEAQGSRVAVTGADGRERIVDEIVAVTGFRPDASMTSELRLDLDPALEAPARLAPLIDPNVHTCGSVPLHGEPELAHPEPLFYVVGMKSYGRAPTFLMRTGYEQVRSVVTRIAQEVGRENEAHALP